MLKSDPLAKPRKWTYEDDIHFLLPHFHEKPTKTDQIKVEDVEFEENDVLEDKSDFFEEAPDNFTVTHFEDNETKGMQSVSEVNSEINTNATLKEDVTMHLTSETLVTFLLKELEDKTKIIKELENKSNNGANSTNEDFFAAIRKTVNNFSMINQNIVKSKIFSAVSEVELKELKEKQIVDVKNGIQCVEFIDQV